MNRNDMNIQAMLQAELFTLFTTGVGSLILDPTFGTVQVFTITGNITGQTFENWPDEPNTEVTMKAILLGADSYSWVWDSRFKTPGRVVYSMDGPVEIYMLASRNGGVDIDLIKVGSDLGAIGT